MPAGPLTLMTFFLLLTGCWELFTPSLHPSISLPRFHDVSIAGPSEVSACRGRRYRSRVRAARNCLSLKCSSRGHFHTCGHTGRRGALQARELPSLCSRQKRGRVVPSSSGVPSSWVWAACRGRMRQRCRRGPLRTGRGPQRLLFQNFQSSRPLL